MTLDDDLLAAVVKSETPALDARLSAHVHRVARAEMTEPTLVGAEHVRLVLRGAVVPALLISAGVVHGAEAVQAEITIQKGAASPSED